MSIGNASLGDIFRRDKVALEKAGATGLTDTTIGGTVPQASVVEFIDLMNKADPFFLDCTTYTPDEPEQPIDVHTIADDIIQTVPDGTDPTSFTQGGNDGSIITCKPVKAFMKVLYQTADSTRGAKAISVYQAQMADRFGRNTLKIGCIGTSYVETSQNTSQCGVGWLKNLKDANAHIVDSGEYLSSGKIQLPEMIDDILEDLPSKWDSSEVALHMNRATYRKMVRQLIDLTKTADLVLTGNVPTYLGYPIKIVRDFPTGEIVATSSKNFCRAIQKQMQKLLEDHQAGCYWMHGLRMRIGFGVALPDAAVYAYDVTPTP